MPENYGKSLLNIQRKQRIKNPKIRKQTDKIDVLEHSQRLKWKWAGDIALQKFEEIFHKANKIST